MMARGTRHEALGFAAGSQLVALALLVEPPLRGGSRGMSVSGQDCISLVPNASCLVPK